MRGREAPRPAGSQPGWDSGNLTGPNTCQRSRLHLWLGELAFSLAEVRGGNAS